MLSRQCELVHRRYTADQETVPSCRSTLVHRRYTADQERLLYPHPHPGTPPVHRRPGAAPIPPPPPWYTAGTPPTRSGSYTPTPTLVHRRYTADQERLLYPHPHPGTPPVHRRPGAAPIPPPPPWYTAGTPPTRSGSYTPTPTLVHRRYTADQERLLYPHPHPGTPPVHRRPGAAPIPPPPPWYTAGTPPTRSGSYTPTPTLVHRRYTADQERLLYPHPHPGTPPVHRRPGAAPIPPPPPWYTAGTPPTRSGSYTPTPTLVHRRYTADQERLLYPHPHPGTPPVHRRPGAAPIPPPPPWYTAGTPPTRSGSYTTAPLGLQGNRRFGAGFPQNPPHQWGCTGKTPQG